MPKAQRGHTVPLSLTRRLVCDVLHFARQIPSVPVQRRMSLAPLAAARQACAARPSWVALFAKAFALVAAENPRLRQSYLSFPYPRLYEHADSVATISVERQFEGEDAIFFGRLKAPDRQSLASLDGHLHQWKTAPIYEVRPFRQALQFTRLPRPLRRLGWWYALNASGARREKHFGTFGISVYSSLGVDSLHPIAPMTTLLNYGRIAPDGQVDVRIIYDHRVLDGATIGRTLVRLEETLCETMVMELSARDRELPLAG
jgi:hypothetical protein